MNRNDSSVMWFKSSHSSPSQDCVEVAFLGRSLVGMRDSKNPDGPTLVFSATRWDEFVADIGAGRFDRR
ncbi:DUF397 domain-containing protein [Nocardia arthritidis]|uniref:DUF397 domain-containing protein n=1 Tax=Nocardia arthritidis TaxID=228602 RepID=A0A6G9YAR7_9NOCA|nr:DUF397 domain-containing protein [Nocardia arthritidis]QIS10355.1 DUF397 domain-containing protein [Nocardia arthritidis]